MIKLNTIKSNPNNPRIIKDDKFKKLCRSLQDLPKMMELRPIVVDDNNVVQGGNMRLKALTELGYKEIPETWVKQAKDFTDEELKEFIIKDNVGFGEWDWDDLANNWDVDKLSEWGLDIPNFEPEVLEAEEDDYEVPEEIKTDIVIGDLFEIGEHRLLCGDSTDSDQVAKLMNGDKADILHTDPPYNVNYEGNYIQSGKILKKEQKVWNGGIENDNRKDFGSWLMIAYENINLYLNEGCAIYIWHPSGEDCKHFWNAWIYDKWHFQVDIIWNKTSLIISRWDYKPQHEPCMYGWKGKNRSWIGPNNISTVWDIKRQQGNSGEKRQHPTQKPIELVSIPLKNHDSNIILDPFSGSGSTMVAAHQLKRKCYGMELDPKYCQVIIDRMRKLDPNLRILRNGQPYAETH